MITKIAVFLFVCVLVFISGFGAARAQTVPALPVPSQAALRRTPSAKASFTSITGTVRERPKRFRLYLEDLLSANLSYDLNPESRGLIVSPSVGILYVFPQVGLTARTPGSRYVSFGATQNVFIASPILQVSYGQQWRTSYFEIGLVGFEPTSATRHDYDGPKVVPRLALGTRF